MQMDELQIALLENDTLPCDFPDARVIGPEVFQKADGLEKLIEALGSEQSVVYVDMVFGIVVSRGSLLPPLVASANKSGAVLRSIGNPAFYPIVPIDDQAAGAQLPDFWHLARLGGWPFGLSGKGVKVGMIDTGIAPDHPNLPRPVPDTRFASLHKLGASTNDFKTGHGTHCAGLIAGNDVGSFRIGVAPDCELFVGQRSDKYPNGHVMFVDLILLACWAVHWGKVRAISFSFTVRAREARAYGNPNFVSEIAWRLRRKNVALIFCASGNEHGPMLLPAACSGVVAVGGYEVESDNISKPLAKTRLSGFDQYPPVNRDFLLGPASHVFTTELNSIGSRYFEEFKGSSAACAWVAGIAALYFERYPESTVEEVLLRMFQDAETVHCPHGSGRTWKAARFPL